MQMLREESFCSQRSGGSGGKSTDEAAACPESGPRPRPTIPLLRRLTAGARVAKEGREVRTEGELRRCRGARPPGAARRGSQHRRRRGGSSPLAGHACPRGRTPALPTTSPEKAAPALAGNSWGFFLRAHEMLHVLRSPGV